MIRKLVAGGLVALALPTAAFATTLKAREALLESVPAEGPIGPLTWFALGLIAQALDDRLQCRQDQRMVIDQQYLHEAPACP